MNEAALKKEVKSHRPECRRFAIGYRLKKALACEQDIESRNDVLPPIQRLISSMLTASVTLSLGVFESFLTASLLLGLLFKGWRLDDNC